MVLNDFSKEKLFGTNQQMIWCASKKIPLLFNKAFPKLPFLKCKTLTLLSTKLQAG